MGVIGFCMGGGLALVLATQRPDAVKAVVPAYGLIPWPDAQPDFSELDAAVLGHAAGQDDYFTPEAARELEAQLTGAGQGRRVPPLPRRRPRLLQRGPTRGIPPRVGRSPVGALCRLLPEHAELNGHGARLVWSRVPDPGPTSRSTHRRAGRRVLRSGRAIGVDRHGAGASARPAGGRGPGPAGRHRRRRSARSRERRPRARGRFGPGPTALAPGPGRRSADHGAQGGR